jgi:hypothetical protein
MTKGRKRANDASVRPKTKADVDAGIDEAERESFPASDPPSTSPMTAGAPKASRSSRERAASKGAKATDRH